MDRYYYLTSQLPVLIFDKESYLDTDSFLEKASLWMSKRHYKRLSHLSLFNPDFEIKKPRLWQNIIEFEKVFRNEIAEWRKAHRTGQDIKPQHFPLSLVKEGNPLEIEKKLLYWRWQFLNELEKEHHFDFEFLIIYFLKLQILKKLSLYDQQKGMDIFKSMENVEMAHDQQNEAGQSESS